MTRTTLIVLVLFICLFAVIAKTIKANKVKSKILENQKKREEDFEKRREEDLRHDRIINCFHCKGTGECFHIYSTYFNPVTLSDDYSSHYHWPPGKWASEFEKEQYEKSKNYLDTRSNDKNYSIFLVNCPLCDGKGIAYAYYEKNLRMCAKCKGVGKIVDTKKIKIDIGAIEEKKTIECNNCNGTGELQEVIVHAITLRRPSNLSDSYYKKSITLNKDNNYLFSNSKPKV